MLIRAAVATDAPAMTELLNRIIAIGGTTAHQHPKSAEQVREDYIDGPDTITCVVAEMGTDLIGWQAIGWWNGDAHIGTFVAPDGQAKGTGQRLFDLTKDIAKTHGLTTIHATIRADNIAGKAFYARIGFVEFGQDPDWALEDGRRVGRVHRRFAL
ncbi:MAG: GNAT family N-acetyltransferase [Rhodobacteraceae bacterium]|nr:GNAT family N-acetyltransferase [Paracoccaceae bacterium]MCF8512927.1 GNAT family N-acetyltransferase [Paracoccaceae bacterium]MCF8517172.1 GNAT family N-acetyltransferase [Paracoccaceae bacterium]